MKSFCWDESTGCCASGGSAADGEGWSWEASPHDEFKLLSVNVGGCYLDPSSTCQLSLSR